MVSQGKKENMVYLIYAIPLQAMRVLNFEQLERKAELPILTLYNDINWWNNVSVDSKWITGPISSDKKLRLCINYLKSVSFNPFFDSGLSVLADLTDPSYSCTVSFVILILFVCLLVFLLLLYFKKPKHWTWKENQSPKHRCQRTVSDSSA